MKKRVKWLAAATAILLCGTPGIFAKSADAADGLVPLKKYGVTVDAERGVITGIPGTPTAKELCGMFESGEDIVVRNSAGGILAAEDPVPSGASVISGDNAARAVIYGDADMSAGIDLKDVITVIRHISGWEVSFDELAADVDLSGTADSDDIIALLRFIAGWHGIYLGKVGMTVVSEPQTAENEADDITVSFGNGIDKYTPASDIGNNVTYLMNCAKGEIEFTQFTVAVQKSYSGLTLNYTPFTNAKGETVRTEMYLEKFTNMASIITYAEVLEPFLNDFSIAAGKHQPFGIKAYPTLDSSYGLYESEITITDGDGRELKRALVYLNVWDFELPSASSMRTSLGLFRSYMRWMNNPSIDVDLMYRKYYDFFIENRMNPVNLPYSFEDEEVTEYLNDDRINSFLVGGIDNGGYGGEYYRTTEQISAAYEFMSDHPEWLAKAYFYFDDEPINTDKFDSIKNHFEYARTIFPGAKMIIPNHYNYDYGDTDIVGFVMKYSSILCPHTWMFTNPDDTDVPVWYTRDMELKYGTLIDRINAKLASDETAEFWWYTSDNPHDTYCNLTPTKPGIENRTLFWQQYLYGSKGFLYWSTNDWSSVSRGCTYVSQENCGLLVYPFYFYPGMDKPIGGIRFELVRDGIEDFDYLSLIEKNFGKDVADSFVERITTGIRKYNTDSAVLYKVRSEMGELLQGWN